jgi:hypothetical protein
MLSDRQQIDKDILLRPLSHSYLSFHSSLESGMVGLQKEWAQGLERPAVHFSRRSQIQLDIIVQIAPIILITA